MELGQNKQFGLLDSIRKSDESSMNGSCFKSVTNVVLFMVLKGSWYRQRTPNYVLGG